jgi:hypothetical protein
MSRSARRFQIRSASPLGHDALPGRCRRLAAWPYGERPSPGRRSPQIKRIEPRPLFDHTGPCSRTSTIRSDRASISRNVPNQTRANGPIFSLAAEGKLLAPSFGPVTRFGHINLWNTSSFSQHVFPFRSITLRSHQFVIEPRCDGSSSRQWKRVCDFYPFVLGYLRNLRCRSEASLCLFTIIRLLKRLFQTKWSDFRSDVPVA